MPKAKKKKTKKKTAPKKKKKPKAAPENKAMGPEETKTDFESMEADPTDDMQDDLMGDNETDDANEEGFF